MYLHVSSVHYGLGGLVVTDSAAGSKDRGSIPRSPEHIWDLILGPLHWQASGVGYALYGCTQTVIV